MFETLPEIPLEELAYLPAAFTDQPDNVDIGLRVAGDHAEQDAFSHSGARKDAHALALSDRKKPVEASHAQIEGFGDPLLFEGVYRVAVDGRVLLGRQRPETVDGIAETVDHTAKKAIADGHIDDTLLREYLCTDTYPPVSYTHLRAHET